MAKAEPKPWNQPDIGLVGLTTADGRKVLFTIVFTLLIVLLSRLSSWHKGLALGGGHLRRAELWTRAASPSCHLRTDHGWSAFHLV